MAWLLNRNPGRDYGEISLAKNREGDVMDWTKIRFDPERLYFTAA
jgi:hypothetical protein